MNQEEYGINHAFIEGRTHRAILTVAIRKALDNGWRSPYDDEIDFDQLQWTLDHYLGALTTRHAPEELIFNHEFAKALWSGRPYHGIRVESAPLCRAISVGHQPADWQVHLRNMVLAEDPIQYLADNMPEDK